MSSRTKRDSFKKGDRVSARWSGSNVFYDAKVVDVTARNYKVQYDDGSISSLKYSDVKKLEASKTPPKTTKPPPEKKTKTPPEKKTRISKSRSRSRSAGRAARSRSRSKSPARNEKKSEKKTAKKSPKVEKKVEASPKNSSPKNSLESKATVSRDTVDGILSKISLTRQSVTTTKSETVTKRNSSTAKDSSESSSASERPRSSTRLAALRSAQAIRVSNAISKSKYSDDEEESEEEEKVSVPDGLSNTWKTLYFTATVLKMVLVPASLLFLVFACTRKQCTVLDIPQFYTRWRDFFNSVKLPLVAIFGFHLLQAALSLVPLGRKAQRQDDKSGFEYRINGLLALLLHVIVFGACSYFGVYTNFGYDKFRAIALSAAIYSFVCAIILHVYAVVKGGATTKSKVPFLGSFYNGSYSNPVLFGKLDLKTSFIRAGLIGSVMLNLSIVVKFFLMKGYVTVPLALTSGMQAFFVLDFFAREEKWLTTATYTTDSLGYAFIMTTGFLVPVGLSLQNVYLFTYENRSTHVPHWCAGAMVALFFLGYYIYLASTNMKHNFRKDPFSPSFAGIVSVPTRQQKRRLIASGPWGRIRHPNYIGLAIMALAWSLPCGFVHLVPFGPLILLTVALIIRTLRIEAECSEKYGPAWKNYCEKVRKRLIPYIF